MSDELARRELPSKQQTQDPTERVKQSLRQTQGSSLGDLAKARKQQQGTALLLDYSSSMGEGVNGHRGGGVMKIEALRTLVKDLEADSGDIQKIIFGGYGRDEESVRFSATIPDPAGCTPLAEGIEFATRKGLRHLIVISDGEPDDRERALDAARSFNGPIDIFYVGPEEEYSARDFMRKLAKITGGQVEVTSLKDTKLIQGKIAGLLGTGTKQISDGKKAIQL